MPVPNPRTERIIAPAQAVLPIVADTLTGRGFDLRSPVWERSCSLNLTNVRGSLCEINLTDSGAVVWEYRPFHGTPVGPAQIVDMVTTLLAADPACAGLPIEQRPGWTFKAAVGKALAQRGLAVRLNVTDLDKVTYEVYAEIEATNPVHPSRGAARVGDDHSIRWECLLAGPPTSTGGLAPEAIANTIAAALTDHTI